MLRDQRLTASLDESPLAHHLASGRCRRGGLRQRGGGHGRLGEHLGADCGVAFGRDIPGLTGYLQTAVDTASDGYVNTLNGADATTRAHARAVFAAAAAAYVYGFPGRRTRDRQAFPTQRDHQRRSAGRPSVQTVVAPNVDTAYTVAWLDLTNGPIVINVPDTGGRFYTFQFLDAFTNAFAYVGTGSTGTKAGAYALVPPGYSGALPSGVTPIDAPSNTVWLLGRTLVNNPADLPAVKALQEQYEATPLTAWEQGTRQAPVVLDQYPPTIPKSIPTGSQFIATLNDEMNIDPPSEADSCALQAMAPAGVQVPHPTAAQSLLSDLSWTRPRRCPRWPVPGHQRGGERGHGSRGSDHRRRRHHAQRGQPEAPTTAGRSWAVGRRYGTRYLPRAIVATNLLADPASRYTRPPTPT